jgi:hypothetical protein
MKIILDIVFQCQPSCGLGSQTRYVTCQGSDGNISDKCVEEKPITERQCKVTCFDNLVLNGGSKNRVTVVDGQHDSVNNHYGESGKTQAANVTDFAEFLEISNSCLQRKGYFNTFLILFLQANLMQSL